MIHTDNSRIATDEGAPLVVQESRTSNEELVPKSTSKTLSIFIAIAAFLGVFLFTFFILYQPGTGNNPSSPKDSSAEKIQNNFNETSRITIVGDEPIKNVDGKFSPLIDCSGYCRTYIDKYTPIITTKKPNLENDAIEKKKKKNHHLEDQDSSVENSLRSHDARKEALQV